MMNRFIQVTRGNITGRSKLREDWCVCENTRVTYPANNLSSSSKCSESKMSQSANNSTLKVAITCRRRRYITKNESEKILAAIQQQIISDAKAPAPQKMQYGPTFKAKPLFEDGAIKMWCANNDTLTWLEQTVRKISSTSYLSTTLIVMSQSEIKKRFLGKCSIPDKQVVFKEKTDILKALFYQNPFLDADKLEILSVVYNEMDQFFSGSGIREWHVEMMFPESQKRVLEEAGCSLAIGLTAVKVKF